MNAPQSIMYTWRKFDTFPMETITKAWLYPRRIGKKQRDVNEMKEHRSEYGVTGNCFDLAIWLLDEFRKDGIDAYPIGHDVGTPEAHVAVIALDEDGRRYMCDLGDQWLNPILIDKECEEFTEEKLAGFFPAAKVQIKPEENQFEVFYHRPNGKTSRQTYCTERIDEKVFMKSAEFSQNQISGKPLLEIRTPFKNEVAHWEFYNWKSYLSTTEGIFHDQPLITMEEWALRIHVRTGYSKQFVVEALNEFVLTGK
jgi:hypothetical protein